MVGVLFAPTQPLGRFRAPRVVVRTPEPGVPSVHFDVQFTVMWELGVSAASSEAVSVWVKVWDAAPVAGVALFSGDAENGEH